MSSSALNEEEVFQAARRIESPDARAVYLQQVCGSDKVLYDRVVELLGSPTEADAFLENPPSAFIVDASFLAASENATHVGLAEKPGMQIGPYKLLQQIGEGGMGVVWMAEQTQPVQRKVALKVIKPGMDSRKIIARFEVERQALAIMDHINIARVLDAGATPEGRPYFVMELVHGVPITKYCDDNRLTLRQRLELFVPVCQAIQHAHQKGIIHRDIKPSNVMVTLYDGQPVPKVIDFGVAKATEQKLSERTLFTEYGTMVGTLEYMSPEQAEMSALGVDTRSDIYSLGVLMYELLTGSTPLDRQRMRDAAFGEMLRVIKEVDPVRPSTRLSESGASLASISAQRQVEPAKLTKLVRGELDWIVMKSLEKDRNRRYETASGFAADIQHYLQDEPVLACPPSASYRFRKFARKNRAVITTVSLMALIMVIGTAVSTWQAIRATEAEKQTDDQRKVALANSLDAQRQASQARLAQSEMQLAKQEADRQRNAVTQNLYYADMRLGLLDWSVGNVGRLSSALLSHAPISETQDNRGWEWYYLLSLCHQDEGTLVHHVRPVVSVGFSLDGRFLASAGSDGIVNVYDSTNWRIVRTWQGENVWGASWSPDGEQIAWTTTPPDDQCFVGHIGSGERIALAGHSGSNRPPVWSPDSKRVASRRGANVQVWDVETNSSVSAFGRLQIGAVSWRSDGTLMMLSQYGNELKTWNASSGDASFPLNLQDMTHGSWSPDGTLIACGTAAGICRVYKTADWSVVSEWKAHTGAVTKVEWDPEGEQLASAGTDNLIQLWDPATGSNLLTLRGHLNQVLALAWEPTGHRLVSGGMDGLVKVWPLPPSPQPLEIVGHQGGVRDIAWSDDGASLISFGITDGTVACWNAYNGQLESELQVEVGAIGQISPGGNLLAITPMDNKVLEIHIRDRRSGEVIKTFKHGTIRAAHSAFSPDASKLAITDRKNLEILDLQIDELKLHVIGDQYKNLAWSPDGQLLAVVGLGDPTTAKYGDKRFGAWVHFFETAKYQRTLKVRHGTSWVPVTAVCWSPNGKQLVAGDANGLVEVWEVATGRKLISVQLHVGHINDLDWSPNSQRVASSSADGTVRIWDPTSGQELLKLDVRSNEMKLVAWSPDGRRLAAAADGPIYVWDATAGYEYVNSDEYEYEMIRNRFNTAIQLFSVENMDEAFALIEKLLAENIRVVATNQDWFTSRLKAVAQTNLFSGHDDDAIRFYKVLVSLEPNDPLLLNSLAWNLATCANTQFRDVQLAVALAQRAVGLDESSGHAWNTLGVAQYCNRSWQSSIDALQKSVELRQGGDSFDWYFLAMAYWQLNEKDEARKWFDKAVDWMEKKQPKEEELIRFREEAEELMSDKSKDSETK